MTQEETHDKGIFGLEYALMYTILDFEQKVIKHWNKDHANNKDYVHKKFNLLRSCMQGIVVAKWDNCCAKCSDDKKNDKGFRSCIRDYLESIAKCTTLAIK